MKLQSLTSSKKRGKKKRGMLTIFNGDVSLATWHIAFDAYDKVSPRISFAMSGGGEMLRQRLRSECVWTAPDVRGGEEGLMADKPSYANGGCKCDGVDNEITKFSLYIIQRRLEGGVESRRHPSRRHPFEH